MGGAGCGVRTIRIASNGQRSTHSAQPVQAGASCSTAHLRPQGSPSCGSTCSDSTLGGHTPTHQPQPVQRPGSMAGRALGRGAWGAWEGVVVCAMVWAGAVQFVGPCFGEMGRVVHDGSGSSIHEPIIKTGGALMTMVPC